MTVLKIFTIKTNRVTSGYTTPVCQDGGKWRGQVPVISTFAWVITCPCVISNS